jgi:hypothetical protein
MVKNSKVINTKKIEGSCTFSKECTDKIELPSGNKCTWIHGCSYRE